MTDTVRYRLNRQFGWVDASTYPDAGGCNILCLTDRELSIVRQLVYPRCVSSSSFAVPIFDNWFEVPVDALYSDYVGDVDSLLDKLGSGANMDCQAFLDELAAMSFTSKMQGYYGAGWRNAGIPRNITAPLVATWQNLSLAAGTNNVDSTAVPASTVWVVTSLFFVYAGTAPTLVQMGPVISGSNVLSFQVRAPVSNQGYDRQGEWVLGAGDYIRVAVIGATLNDDLTGYLAGYTISVA